MFFAILFSSLLFRQEKMSGKKLLGCIVGFAGVVLVNLGGGGEDLRLQSGDIYILISAAAYGMSSVLIKKYSQWENPVMLSGYQFLAGGLLMMAERLRQADGLRCSPRRAAPFFCIWL